MKVKLKRQRLVVRALERALSVMDRNTPTWASVATALEAEKRRRTLLAVLCSEPSQA